MRQPSQILKLFDLSLIKYFLVFQFVLLGFFSNMELQAQQKTWQFFTAVPEMSIGNFFGGGASLSFCSSVGPAISFGAKGAARASIKRPKDYSGMLYALDEFDFFYLTPGYRFNVGGKHYLLVSIGGGFFNFRYPTNFKKKSGPVWFGPNYEYDENRKSEFGLIHQTRLVGAYSRRIGLSWGYSIIKAGNVTSVSADLSAVFGRLRK